MCWRLLYGALWFQFTFHLFESAYFGNIWCGILWLRNFLSLNMCLWVWWHEIEWLPAFFIYYNIFKVYPCCSICCCCSVTQLCLTLCNPMDCSVPGVLACIIMLFLMLIIFNYMSCAQLCLTLCDPMDYSSLGSSAHRIF